MQTATSSTALLLYTEIVIVAFVDESGNDSQSSVFAMATILLSHQSSYYLANDWQSLLKDFAVSEFHASDFHGSRGEFRWPRHRRAAFAKAVVRLLRKWEVKHSAVLVSNEDYKRSFVHTGFHKTIRPAVSKWKKPYLQAFMGTILDLRGYADHQPKGLYITPVFDYCQEFMGQAYQDYRQKNLDGKLGNMQISTTRVHVQLQAADFLAWEYRVSAERYVKTGERLAESPLKELLEHGFGARVWRFDHLDYLRRRVEAVGQGTDPEEIPEPS